MHREGEFVSDLVGDLLPLFFRVPEGLVELLRDNPSQFVTPQSFAIRHNVDVVDLPERPPALEAAAATPLGHGVRFGANPDQAIVPARTLDTWRQRGAGWRSDASYDMITPHFEIHSTRLSFELQNYAELQTVLRLSARVLNPQCNTSLIRAPTHEMIRLNIIKLDLLMMKHKRLLWDTPDIRIAVFLSPDSSPQGRYDFLNCRMELMIRPLPIVIDPADPLGGFKHVKDCLPVMTLAKGEKCTANRLQRIAHSVVLQSGTSNLWKFRIAVKGFLSDRGSSDRRLPKSAFGTAAELEGSRRALAADRLNVLETKKNLFLPYSMDQYGPFHIIFVALENAIKNVPEWPDFVSELRGLCALFGGAETKPVLLAKVYTNYSAAERKRIHGFSHAHVDWRWENLEDVLFFIIDLYEMAPLIRMLPDLSHINARLCAQVPNMQISFDVHVLP